MLLNHAASAVAGLNERILEGVIDERIRLAYIFILSAFARICEERINRRVPIFVHGYDYPVADGRGFGGAWGGPLPGPWFNQDFAAKGIRSLLIELPSRRSLLTDLTTC